MKGESGIEVDLRAGNAQDLPFTDAHFDAVVAMHALCTIRDEMGRSRGSEGLVIWRMVAPIRARPYPLPPRARFAGRFQPTLAVLLENHHLLCEPLLHVEDAVLVVERLERSKLDIVEWLVAAGHRF